VQFLPAGLYWWPGQAGQTYNGYQVLPAFCKWYGMHYSVSQKMKRKTVYLIFIGLYTTLCNENPKLVIYAGKPDFQE
jgi:hypothetical protein